MKLRIDLGGFEILEKIPGRFGNGAHVSFPKEHIGKTVKIITGNSKIVKKEMVIDLFESEILEGKITKFGTGAHVIIPKRYAGKKIKIIMERKNE